MAALYHQHLPRSRGADPVARRAGAVVAVILHGLVAAALLSYEPARTALFSVAPIMVELITPPRAPEPQPVQPIQQPKPKPVAKVIQPPKPVAPVAPITAPPTVVAVPTEAPAPVVSAPPSPAGPAVASAPPTSAEQGSSGGPVAVTPPIFSADYLENPSPAYPPVSRRMREEGRVMLRVHVTPQGAADEVQVRTTSGIARLDEAAVETVRRWKFVPAKRGSDAVAAWVLIPISFKLEG